MAGQRLFAPPDLETKSGEQVADLFASEVGDAPDEVIDL